MPCFSDYQQHSEREAESGRVLEFLKELRGEPFDHNNPSYYGRVKTLDRDTAELCTTLRDMPSTNHLSLELQLWWKRHQEFDRAREAAEKTEIERQKIKKQALSKLTAEERKILGV